MKFKFAGPSEIQYEIRKKHTDFNKQEGHKVRSLRASITATDKAKDYTMIMHVP